MQHEDIHYCPFCEKDRVLTEQDTCSKCGRNFTEGMEEDKLLELIKDYRELVRGMSRLVDFKLLAPGECRRILLAIRAHVVDISLDEWSISRALKDITSRLRESDDEELEDEE